MATRSWSVWLIEAAGSSIKLLHSPHNGSVRHLVHLDGAVGSSFQPHPRQPCCHDASWELPISGGKWRKTSELAFLPGRAGPSQAHGGYGAQRRPASLVAGPIAGAPSLQCREKYPSGRDRRPIRFAGRLDLRLTSCDELLRRERIGGLGFLPRPSDHRSPWARSFPPQPPPGASSPCSAAFRV
jgi:hypothetical protein